MMTIMGSSSSGGGGSSSTSSRRPIKTWGISICSCGLVVGRGGVARNNGNIALYNIFFFIDVILQKYLSFFKQFMLVYSTHWPFLFDEIIAF